MELGHPARRTPHPDTPEGPPALQAVTGGVEKGLAEFGTSSAPCSLTLGEHKARFLAEAYRNVYLGTAQGSIPII